MSAARQKFIRLAETRTQKTIDSIRLIGNLSNPTNYSYSEKDVDLIFKAIGEAIKEARSRFKVTGPKDKGGGFRLEDR